MRALLVGASLALSASAFACPACASAQRGGPSWLHLVLVLLPFAVAGIAARAIYRVLRDP